MMHITRTKGDYIFAEWNEDGYNSFQKAVHELRKKGFRKINNDRDYLNYYEYYRKKGSKKVVTVTMMCL